MKITAQGMSDVGIVRDHNEDSFVVNEEINFFMVADGMGGHVAGGRASKLAVEIIEKAVKDWYESYTAQSESEDADSPEESKQTENVQADSEKEAEEGSVKDGSSEEDDAAKLRPKKTLIMGVADDPVATLPKKEEDPVISMLTKAIQKASATILAESQMHPQYSGMGTTATCLFIVDERAYYAHVGDSRLYRIRNGQIEQITQDHSLVQENVRMGLMDEEEARRSPYKNIITRSVGFDPLVQVDTGMLELLPGDKFVLCSDGLSNLVRDQEIFEIVTKQQLETALKFQINLANSRGGDDNITVIVVEVS